MDKLTLITMKEKNGKRYDFSQVSGLPGTITLVLSNTSKAKMNTLSLCTENNEKAESERDSKKRYRTTKERLIKAKKELVSIGNRGSNREYLKAINEEMEEYKIIRGRACRASKI